MFFCFFFFNDTATTEIYTLSLHDALPISPRVLAGGVGGPPAVPAPPAPPRRPGDPLRRGPSSASACASSRARVRRVDSPGSRLRPPARPSLSRSARPERGVPIPDCPLASADPRGLSPD